MGVRLFISLLLACFLLFLFYRSPKITPIEVWTIFGIGILAYFLPRLQQLPNVIRSIQVGNLSVELKDLKKNAINSKITDRYLFGTLFAQQQRWTEAADMFSTLRTTTIL